MEENIIVNLNDVDLIWAEKEFIDVHLNDKRLDARLVTIAQAFNHHPQASIPQAMGDWANSKATYRFFDNPKVTFEKILKPHKQRTRQRMANESVVLAIQDTSFIDYTSHPATKDIGFLSDENHHGLILHPTLLATPNGLPLGIIDTQIIMRETIGVKKQRCKKPIEEKESYKWLKSYHETAAFSSSHIGTHVINIADREGDIYDYFADVLKHKKCMPNAPDVLVRASHNRNIEEEERHIWEYLNSQKIAATREIEVPRNKEHDARKATLSIRYAQITLKPPKNQYFQKSELLPIYAVYAHEENPPKKTKPVSWMLLTTIEITNVFQAVEAIRWYVCRWLIELYFKVLKSGCTIEERQLEAAHRLVNCLAIDSIIAWRILFITMIGRERPDLPATVIFEEAECNALYAFIAKKPVELETAPSLGNVIREIAKLGGFLARKSDGDPGVICIWRGMWRIADITATWGIFNPNFKGRIINNNSPPSPPPSQTYG